MIAQFSNRDSHLHKDCYCHIVDIQIAMFTKPSNPNAKKIPRDSENISNGPPRLREGSLMKI